MFIAPLPERVDAHRLARLNRTLMGEVELGCLAFLDLELDQGPRKVTVEAQFGIDEQGFHYVSGQLETQVLLPCQRCLQAFELDINSRFRLSPINDDKKAESLPSHYEPILMEEGQLSVWHLVVEEILLNLPLVSLHNEADKELCFTHKPELKTLMAESQGAVLKISPFQVLESLKSS